MGSVRVTANDIFPTGTTIGAYLASGWAQHQLPPSGAPPVAAAITATMADGGVLLAGLADNTDYYVGADLGGGRWRYTRVRTGPAAEVPDSPLGQSLMRKLYAGQGGVLLVLGDSTGDALDEWVANLARSIGAQLPRLRVDYVAWSDGGSSWPATTALQAGDGTFGTLTVYNCSVGGKETHYFLAPNFDAMVGALHADLVIINLGHNENTAAADPFWRDDLLALAETVTLYLPDAELIVLTQNPRTDSSATQAQQRRDMTQRLARMRGWGCIDTYARFLDANGNLTNGLLLDALHPNALGEDLLLDEIRKRLVYAPGIPVRGQAESSLLRPLATPLLNADFASFAVPPTLTNWTATQATLTRDATNFQGPNGYSVRMQQASAATSYIEQAISSNALKPYLGRWVTFIAWIRRLAGASSNAGRVHMRTTGGSNTISLNSFATAQGQGDFIPVSISGRIDKTAGTVTVRVYCENGTTGTQDVSVDRCWFGSGLLPRDLR